MEEEAESREGTEAYEPDKRSEVEIGGEVFLLSRSEEKEIIAEAIEETVRWFEMQKVILDEKEYFHLISTYAAWKEGRIL